MLYFYNLWIFTDNTFWFISRMAYDRRLCLSDTVYELLVFDLLIMDRIDPKLPVLRELWVC